jgi:hypothetical protein
MWALHLRRLQLRNKRGRSLERMLCALRVQFHCVFLDFRTSRELMKRGASAGAGIERARPWREPQ